MFLRLTLHNVKYNVNQNLKTFQQKIFDPRRLRETYVCYADNAQDNKLRERLINGWNFDILMAHIWVSLGVSHLNEKSLVVLTCFIDNGDMMEYDQSCMICTCLALCCIC